MRVRWGAHAVAAACVVVAACELRAGHQPGLGGYDDAAARAMAASQTRRLFFQGRHDSTFIWSVRRRDPDLAYTVVRASKTLSSGEPETSRDFRALLERPEEILARLEELGVDVVACEDTPEIDAPPYRAFLGMLSSDRFEALSEVTIRHPEKRTAARRLSLYHFRGGGRPAGTPAGTASATPAGTPAGTASATPAGTPAATPSHTRCEIRLPVTALGPSRELRVDMSRPLRGWRRGRGGEREATRADRGPEGIGSVQGVR